MGIKFYSEKNQYVIETKDSTYSFYHVDGQLKSAYWGKRIVHPSDIPMSRLGIGECYGDGYHNRDLYNTEFVGWGSFYYAEPTLKMTFADGTRELRLRAEALSIEDNNVLVAVYKDVDYDVCVRVIYRVYEELNIIDRNCIIENHTGNPVYLNKAASASLSFPYRDEAYRLTSLYGYWGHEYDIHREPVPNAKVVLESRAGISNISAYPYFALDEGKATENEGEVWYGTLQWSGNWKISVETDTMKVVRVTGGLNDFDFCYKLEDGMSFETPVFTLGYTQSGFSGASRQLHDYTRNYLCDEIRRNQYLPVVYNSFGNFGIGGVEEQKLLNIVDKVADLGVEMFVVDDGWFGASQDGNIGIGDWWPSKERFPQGLGRLIQKVNDRGMVFGIWVEPENVSVDSEIYRAHPEWVMCVPTREHEPCSMNRLILNLANEEVYQHLIHMFDELLSNNNIGYLKWDMNRWFTPPASSQTPSDEWQNIWVDYVKNLYRILAHIHERYPHVMVENCSSGGLRADLGMMKYCACINRSDNQDPVDELYLHEGFTYVNLACAGGAESVLSASGYGCNLRDCPLEFKAHIANLSSMAVNYNLDAATEEELEEIKGYIAMHKELRHIVRDGDLYRLASLREQDYMAVQHVTKDKSESLVILFGPCRTFMEAFPNLKLYGLEDEALYEVTFIGATAKKPKTPLCMHGDALMKYGIPGAIHIRGSMRSVMFYLKKIDDKCKAMR